MIKLPIAALLSLALVLAVPFAAQATLPNTGNTLIVPGKSLGGVALGSSANKVKKAWGKAFHCPYQCLYQGKAPKGGTAATASVLLENPGANPTPVASKARVWTVFINVGDNLVGTKLKPNFNTPLTRFRTAKGIGIGSTTSQLKHAYHGLRKTGDFSNVVGYSLDGKGTVTTEFTLVRGKITGIAVRSHPGG
jgi:hypothetical protein